jgi:hypothetical protein
MTYRELLAQLQQLTEEQLGMDVVVYEKCADEYWPLNIELVYTTEEQDVLDPNHPVIRF